jgi:hypothetical protein
MAQNPELYYLLDRCHYQMQRDFTLKKLMDTENERLCKQLFEKSKKYTKKLTSSLARHMTGKECLDALEKEEWAFAMKEVFKDLVFKVWKDGYDRYCKQMAAEEKAREKELEKAQKEVENVGKRSRSFGCRKRSDGKRHERRH